MGYGDINLSLQGWVQEFVYSCLNGKLNKYKQLKVLESILKKYLDDTIDRSAYYDMAKLVVGDIYNPNGWYVAQEISNFYKYMKTCEIDLEIKERMLLFLDKLNLEISRLLDMNREIAQTQNQINNMRFNVDNIESRSSDIENKLKTATSEYIAILSIFAGVIIAFMGGISLLGSAFNSLAGNISEYKLFFMVTLVGFIIYNTIVGLIFMIARLTNRNIGVTCKFSGNNCNHCWYFNRMPKILKPFTVVCQAIVKYTYITFVNIILLYLMYLIGILWLYSPNNNLYFKKIIESDSKNIWMIIILFMPIIICLITYISVFTIHKVKAFIRKRKILKNK